MTGELQLTIDGREVPMAEVGRFRALSDAQRVILLTIAVEGSIRSAAAGRILHAHHDGERDRSRYAGSDGWSALKRLERRGLVRKVSRGVWERTAR